jgi:hypothetical protein
VSGSSGEDVLPRILKVLSGASLDRAVFKTPASEVPHIHGTLAIRAGWLTIRMDVDRASVDVPQLGDASSPTTPLTTHLIVDDGGAPAGTDPGHSALAMRDGRRRGYQRAPVVTYPRAPLAWHASYSRDNSRLWNLAGRRPVTRRRNL